MTPQAASNTSIENGLLDAAGIAGTQAAKAYKGHILAAGIEDDKRNFTRFFLLRRTRRILPGANKTSIAFSVKNIAGRALQGSGCIRAAGDQFDQDRVPSSPGTSVGVHVLRRLSSWRRRTRPKCPPSPRRSGRRGQSAGHLPGGLKERSSRQHVGFGQRTGRWSTKGLCTFE